MQGKLESFGAYQKSRELFDHVVVDMRTWMRAKECSRLVSQQLASADSICANIEEGYGRGSRIDYRRFLHIARGSARETAGRYQRFYHWIPADVVQQRVALCDEIIGILTRTIASLTPPPNSD